MALRHALRAYTKKDNRLAYLSLLPNLAIYFGALALAVRASALQNWVLAGIGVLVLGLAGVRLYVLQHDLGHLSFFSSRQANEFWGYAISPFTMAAYPQMRHNHNLHHSYVGDLDARETTEIFTMTLTEWNDAGFWRRLYYRLYRNPVVLIPLGSALTYFIMYRWPKHAREVGVGAMIVHNLSVASWFGFLYLSSGWAGVAVMALAIWIGGMLGVFLVYLQHNFEGTWWDHRPGLSIERAAIQGASCLHFGWLFDEMVANITKHDIHHLVAAIPSYRLRAAHRAVEQRHHLRRIGFIEALGAFRLKLWDEERHQLVPFPVTDAPRTVAASAG
jgi:acyl-lipid omega-6 desaturase (Delta-12 desaturase)